MKSFFFVPGNKPKFLEKISKIEADNIIIDLEDSINPSHLLPVIDAIADRPDVDDLFIRIPYYHSKGSEQFDVFKPLFRHGFSKLVLPKIRTADEFRTVVRYFEEQFAGAYSKLEFIVLIENPILLTQVPAILEFSLVKAIALGSHDYCASMGMTHTRENLSFARMFILNYGKAFGKCVIDIASMNVSDKTTFEQECKDAFNSGYDGKFLIHPWQLDIFRNTSYFEKAELEKALTICNHIEAIGGLNNFSILNLNGEVVERPHLSRYLKILQMSGYGGF